MSPQDRFRRIDMLFRAAAALPPDARDSYLTRHCDGETTILAAVQALLCADNRADGILDRPALLPIADVLAAERPPEVGPPVRIGRYRVIRKLGEGGMGAVFEAEQESPRRRVAIKLLRAAGGSGRLRQRFQQEAEILGRLQHPGIAQILEAGASDAESGAFPFIVMELVQGQTLVDYARATDLDRRERLALFALVCDAVQHAHQHGVIHRDLKPANILVRRDGTISARRDRSVAQPVILDFGVARMTESDLAAITQQTTAGELVGTVPYMSPEQAAGDPAQLDWRSDVYSLGVILYELLTDRLPHDVRRRLVHEAVRSIREDDPTPAGSIDRALRGDIETILGKALEKNKQRRYQSAAELAADIRRYLHEEPIAARPASALYRLRKFSRRNKGIVGGVAAAFAALALAAGVAVRQAYNAERARAEEARLRHAAERQNYYARMVAAASALRRHDIAESRRHIATAPENLRGWEWEHLNARLDDSIADHITGFAIVCAAVSRDGKTMAACNSAGRIRLWSIHDWSPIADYAIRGTVGQRRIEQLAFSADGQHLRADTREGSIHFDAATLDVVQRNDAKFWRRSLAGGIALVDDVETPASLRVQEYAGGQERFRISGGNVRGSVFRFTDDDRLLAFFRSSGEGLIVFRCADGGKLFQDHNLSGVSDLCFSGDGTRLGIALSSGDALILDASTGEHILSLPGHELAVAAIAFAPRGNRIATASSSGTIRLWEASTGTELAILHGNPAAPIMLTFSDDNAWLFSATAAGELRRWSATAAGDPGVLPMPECVYDLAFSPDGSHFAAAALGGDNPLRIWRTSDWCETFGGLDGYLSAIAFDQPGARLAVGRSTPSARTAIISLEGNLIRSVAGHFWRTDSVGFTPNGEHVFSIGNKGVLSVFNIRDGARVHQRQFPGNEDLEGCRGVLSPDGSLLAVAARQRVYLLQTDTWEDSGSFEGHTRPVYALAFSSDGARLATGGRDESLRVWDMTNRALIAELKGHTDEIFAAAFSPDGTRLVSGGRDRVVRVWDARHFEEITQLQGHTSFIYCLAFSPDGRTLASGGGDASVRLWDTQRYRERATQTSPRNGNDPSKPEPAGSPISPIAE